MALDTDVMCFLEKFLFTEPVATRQAAAETGQSADCFASFSRGLDTLLSAFLLM